MDCKIKKDAKSIFTEYEKARSYKSNIGSLGIYEQNKKNERFYSGDQWHGAKCGSDRPLVRYNIIKRIGDYKKAMIGSAPVAIQYSADGIPNTVDLTRNTDELRKQIATGKASFTEEMENPSIEEINLVMSALGDYQKVTAERVKLNQQLAKVLDNAYVAGESVLYTYWDSDIRTGLYADEEQKTPIAGDIACDVLDIENIYYGDAQCEDIQEQPYIIIAQRKSVAAIKREAKKNKINNAEIDSICADKDTDYEAGDRSELEPDESKKATVLTKMWKEYDDDGNCALKAIRVVKNTVIRREWDMRVRLYPLASFRWDVRRNSAYGESEVTHLIPNQIAINRMITANVWAVMMMGMPITVVDGDVIPGPVTNDPGQIIRTYGTAGNDAIRYVNPPNFSPAFSENIMSLISQTMTQAGANDAALGNMNPDNTSAIIALREAATMPLQMMQNRYYQFCEDIARIWAEFWISMYGKRSLKIEDENGTWYMPFDAERYKTLLISVKIDVGASSLWSETQSIRTLDNLLDRQLISATEYLKRLPKGTVPEINSLIKDRENAEIQSQHIQQEQQGIAQGGAIPSAPDEQLGDMSVQGILDGLSADKRDTFLNLPREAQIQMIQQAYTDSATNGGV